MFRNRFSSKLTHTLARQLRYSRQHLITEMISFNIVKHNYIFYIKLHINNNTYYTCLHDMAVAILKEASLVCAG